MLPRLFEFSTNINDFSNKLGLGYLTQVQSAKVKEVLNGEYVLNMTVMQTDRLANEIFPDRCIFVKPNYIDSPQIFVITDTNYSDKGTIEVTAEHIKSMFFNNVILGNNQQEETTLSGTPQQIVSGLLSDALANNYFTFSSTISDSKNIIRSGETLTLGEIFTDDRQGLIRRFGGDLKYNNFSVEFRGHRGTTAANANKVVRYGTKISTFSQQVSNLDEYTHVLAYANVPTRDNTGTAPSPYQNVPTYNGDVRSVVLYARKENTTTRLYPTGSQSGFIKIKTVDFSNKFKNKHGYVNPSAPSGTSGYDIAENQLYNYGKDYVESHTAMKAPAVNIVANYETALDDLSKVNLGDNVIVIYDPLNYKQTHRVTETVFDVIAERYTSVTIGERKFTLYDYINRR